MLNGFALTQHVYLSVAFGIAISGCKLTLSREVVVSSGSVATGGSVGGDGDLPVLSSFTVDPIPAGLTTSPTIQVTGSDASSAVSFEARLIRQDGSVAIAWTTITSGGALTGLTLDGAEEYRIEVRAVDSTGNVSTSQTSDAFRPDSGNCKGSTRLSTTAFASGDGLAEATAYEICNEEQLNLIGADPILWNKHFKLKAHLDLGNLGTAFNMIGVYSPSNNFTGTFDGESRTIKNLSINSGTTDGVGMFASAESGAVFKNLTLENVSVSGDDYVGGLLGFGDENVIVMNVHASGTVNGSTYGAGGLVGGTFTSVRTDGMPQILSSTSSVVVTGNEAVGGIIGAFEDGGIMDNCSATGAISGADSVGGLVGLTSIVQIEDSWASGAITGTGWGIGGAHGSSTNSSDRIYRVYATGAVTGGGASTAVGGLIGYLESTGLSDAYALGNVTGNTQVGGLIGDNSAARLVRVFAAGNVTGATKVGGLVGWHRPGATKQMIDSFALGTVQGNDASNYVGYLFGHHVDGTLSESFSVANSCTNSSGTCGNAGNTVIDLTARPDYFHDALNAPFTRWNQAKTWSFSGTASAKPTLNPTFNTPTTQRIDAGELFTCSVDQAGVARCWGSNYDSDDNMYGRLGINSGTNTDQTSPQLINSTLKYVSIDAGETGACALTSDGKVYCWGGNVNGDGQSSPRLSPVALSSTESFVHIAVGPYHACAITTGGDVQCWGDGWAGKRGDGITTGRTYVPAAITSTEKFYMLSAARNHTCGITTSNALYCWGDNNRGQIGDGTTIQRPTPVLIDSGTLYRYVSTDYETTCAITLSGVLKCWGYNASGQVGDNSTTQRLSPVVVDSGTAYRTVAVGQSSHACGILMNRTIKCWGNNGNGRFGNGNTTASLVPIAAGGSRSFAHISGGAYHTCGAEYGTGALYCWGLNGDGQLGIGNTTQQTSPAAVSGATSGYEY